MSRLCLALVSRSEFEEYYDDVHELKMGSDNCDATPFGLCALAVILMLKRCWIPSSSLRNKSSYALAN